MQVRYRLIDVENAKKEFELLPEIDDENREVGLKQALRLMMPALRELRDKRGYSNDRLLALLREKGFQIGRSTLKVYLRASETNQDGHAKGANNFSDDGPVDHLRGRHRGGSEPARGQRWASRQEQFGQRTGRRRVRGHAHWRHDAAVGYLATLNVGREGRGGWAVERGSSAGTGTVGTSVDGDGAGGGRK